MVVLPIFFGEAIKILYIIKHLFYQGRGRMSIFVKTHTAVIDGNAGFKSKITLLYLF